jgi:hypothetical protein
MDPNSRESLTGFALIALAIESANDKLSTRIDNLTNATNRLSPHGDPRLSNLRRRDLSDAITLGDLAMAAVQLADACIDVMQGTPDPFHDQDS